MIRSKYAGGGKSHIAKHFSKLGYNTLFVVPQNSLSQNIDDDVVTTNKFFAIPVLSNNNLSTLDATTTGVDVYGDLSYTGSLIPSSDKRLKKDIKEVNSKKAVELIRYIKPKTYHFHDDRQQGTSCSGFIANDFMETKKMPDEWQNVVKEGKDGYLKFDYTTCVPILWSALQHTIHENEEMKDLFKAVKQEMATLKGENNKAEEESKT